MYTVYVKADDQGRIIDINSDAFLTGLDGWMEIDSGEGDRYHHAQGNYLPEDIQQDSVCCWMAVPVIAGREAFATFWHNGGEYGIYRRTAAEMDADDAQPESPSESPGAGSATDLAAHERIDAVEQQIDMILSGVTADE